ncbi:hypothetical protein V8E51_006235 [Hyaloscypha variabilis]
MTTAISGSATCYTITTTNPPLCPSLPSGCITAECVLLSTITQSCGCQSIFTNNVCLSRCPLPDCQVGYVTVHDPCGTSTSVLGLTGTLVTASASASTSSGSSSSLGSTSRSAVLSSTSGSTTSSSSTSPTHSQTSSSSLSTRSRAGIGLGVTSLGLFLLATMVYLL